MPTTASIVERLRAAGCVFAEDEADLLLAAALDPEHLERMTAARVRGLPLEQVIGWVDFLGVRVALAERVFVPRVRTGFLVTTARALVRSGQTVLDLCCGSGALGLALATFQPGVRLFAADLDPAAVRCARGNLAPIGGEVFEGDLFAPLPPHLRGQVDVLLVNVPYVPSGAIELLPPEARLYEPRMALDGGVDGLDVLRRVALDAPAWLAPGGHLLTEATAQQAPVAEQILAGAGLQPGTAHDDDSEATVLVALR